MTAESPLARYNYEAFVPDQFEPWMRFDQSPGLGQAAPDFPLWDLDGRALSLKGALAGAAWTVVEFGSFT